MGISLFFVNLFHSLFGGKSTTTTETTTRNTSIKKKAICIGINDYPGTANDLKGCVNDARNWANLLKSRYGFQINNMLLDVGANKAAVIRALKELISSAVIGDNLVVTYSGHGTNVKDTNGDEEDCRDEAICLYDGYLIDDELRDIISKLPSGVKLTVISDSCHSGTVTRAFLSTLNNEEYIKARYMPPEDDVEAFALASMPLKKSFFVPRSDMKEVLISGCQSTEYSYDAQIGGQPTGAFSYYAIDILKNTPYITYEKFYKLLRDRLPNSQYPQTPCLEGSAESLKAIMFE